MIRTSHAVTVRMAEGLVRRVVPESEPSVRPRWQLGRA
jgi:hypothetical protein